MNQANWMKFALSRITFSMMQKITPFILRVKLAPPFWYFKIFYGSSPQCFILGGTPCQAVFAVSDLGLHCILIALQVHNDRTQPFKLLVDIVEG